MKKTLALLAFSVLTLFITKTALFAETIPIEKLIKWKYEIKKVNDTDVDLVITANLYHHFHLFSLKFNPADYDFTGTPTKVTIPTSTKYKLIGTMKESPTKTGSDENGTYIWHEDKGVFTQRIRLNTKEKFELPFQVEWQICNDVMCHIPTQDNLKITVNGDGKVSTTSDDEPASTEPIGNTGNDVLEDMSLQETDALPIYFQINSKKISEKRYEITYTLVGDNAWRILHNNQKFNDAFSFALKDNKDIQVISSTNLVPVKYFDSRLGKEFNVIPTGSSFVQVLELTGTNIPVLEGSFSYSMLGTDALASTEELKFLVDLNKALVSVEDGSVSDSYWGIFFIAFLSGFAALLTPCVFPMIPMTVSYFLKQSQNRAKGIRNAVIYGLSIIIIYITLGLGVTLLFGEQALNAMSTNIYFNLFFFVLLVVFGASFLGAFEIRMPSKWINKSDQNADKGGLIGIFFMAFTLALVSFSCTGPIIGTLLVEATSKGIMGPFFGMLGFSLALALPFALFSAFPGWLNSMPKSGGWLNSVKVVLGFLEIALAFKFLSNADLVVQAHLLEREVFLALWVVIFAMLGLYLMGKITFSHDSPVSFLSVPRLFLSILIFSFVMYMLPGIWGAPVKILSGFLPPQHYSEIPYGIGGSAPEIKLPEHASFGPHGIPVFHDYDDARAYAIANKKPLMIDFTGHACINCRKMEDQVWSSADVKKILTDSVVIASLHVDEKLALPADKQIKDEKGKLIKTVGDKWSYLQKTKYGQQTQPQYIILDDQENKLTPSTSYMTDSDKIEIYKGWLRSGIKSYYGSTSGTLVKGSAIQIAKSQITPVSTITYKTLYNSLYNN